MYMVDEEVLALSRVGDCQSGQVWAYVNFNPDDILAFEWPELDPSCNEPIEPIEYNVFLPFTLNR